jgi:hypothetical protein
MISAFYPAVDSTCSSAPTTDGASWSTEQGNRTSRDSPIKQASKYTYWQESSDHDSIPTNQDKR